MPVRAFTESITVAGVVAGPIQRRVRKGMFFHTSAGRYALTCVAQENFFRCWRKFAKNHVELTADFVLSVYMVRINVLRIYSKLLFTSARHFQGGY